MSKPKKSPTPKSAKRGAKHAPSAAQRATKRAPATPARSRPAADRDPRLPAVGATITKDWRGKALEVKCLAQGFEFRGKEYGSLSRIASDLLGCPANGFLFFGLTGKRPAKAKPAGGKRRSPASDAVDGGGFDLSTPQGERAALAATGIAKGGAKKPKHREGERVPFGRRKETAKADPQIPLGAVPTEPATDAPKADEPKSA